MRTQLYYLFIFLLLITTMNGCGRYQSPVMPFQGVVSVFEAPVDTTFKDTTIGFKSGDANTTTILGLFSFGDASVYAAAKNGNISQIDHIDYGYTNVLGIVVFYKTIVYGE